MKEVVDVIQGDYVVIGGVDQVNTLQEGTPEQVIKATIETMETGKRNGPVHHPKCRLSGIQHSG